MSSQLQQHPVVKVAQEMETQRKRTSIVEQVALLPAVFSSHVISRVLMTAIMKPLPAITVAFIVTQVVAPGSSAASRVTVLSAVSVAQTTIVIVRSCVQKSMNIKINHAQHTKCSGDARPRVSTGLSGSCIARGLFFVGKRKCC